ncbi:DUF7800 domain-containing protein [Flavobacterium davisii]|uniref:DUF7800 domain-containing protein n=1 Tax=Flavobacterium columnare TaxID=996 RepID=A0A8G0KX15_9FLAO|nr:hypothetical protein [Flavobacterium davisii]QYS89994.1 hypothetical protein JJC05_07710 [Flavobacterium davisii]
MLQSGPMVGYCEMTEAVIWLQTTTSANVKLEYFELANPAKKMFSEVYSTKKESGYTCHVLLEKLEPGKKIWVSSISR